MICMLYRRGPTPPSFEELVVNTFLRPASLPFLIVGVGAGGLFAPFAFSIGTVSIPMPADRPKVDTITAIVTSGRAVQDNPGPMPLWAVLVVAITGLGPATAHLGLAIVTVPVIGHATWHACRDLVPDPAPAELGHAPTAAVPPEPAGAPSAGEPRAR